MRRTLLHIGGSALQLPGIRWARSAGLDVVLTDADENAPGRALAQRFHHVSGTDVDALCSVALDLAAEGGFAGAYCSNDFGLPAVAAISQRTGTPGNSPEAVRTALDKRAATERWRSAGVATTSGGVAESADDLGELVRALGYPLIVKPRTSSGSRGVRSIRCEAELEPALSDALTHAGSDRDVLVERWVEGHHVDVNALFVRGELFRGGLLDRYFSAPPHHVPTWGCQPSRLDRSEIDSVYALVEHAARAIEITSGPVKADVVMSPEGPVILELGPRFHGDVSTAHVTPLCGGETPIQSWFRYLAAPEHWVPDSLNPSRQRVAGWMAIRPDRPGVLHEIRGLERARDLAGIEGALTLKHIGHRIETLGDNVSVCGLLIAEGRDENEVKARLSEARAAIEVVID